MDFKFSTKPQWLLILLLSFLLSGMAPSPPLVGGPAPAFELETVEGEVVKMSDLKGQFVILNFWATWCLPCTKEMPELEKAHQSTEHKLKIVGINLAEPKARVAEFMKKHGLSFSVLLDNYGNVSQEYEVVNLPVTYFITPDGIIRDEVFGGGITQKMIEARIKQFD